MPTLHVRGVPEDLHEDLSKMAAERGSSITAETIRLLQKALAFERPGQAELIDSIMAARERRRTGSPSAAELIREDRDR